jgi:DNA gyrase/topoisomerase IV subunit B
MTLRSTGRAGMRLQLGTRRRGPPASLVRQASRSKVINARLATIIMSYASTSDSHDITGSVVRALVLYSLAEFQSGHSTTIRVDAEERSFNVEDDGRGHAIERTIAGSPYLKFVYTHLDYPFAPAQGAQIQLQGIGMSLINALCCELTVTARRQDATLRMSFRGGSLCDQQLFEVKSEGTGNTVSGTVDSQFQKRGLHTQKLQQWLLEVLAASPSLKLFFNGQEIHAPSQSDV